MNTQQQQLRLMDLDQRLAWCKANVFESRVMHRRLTLKIDGHLIVGYVETYDDMLARFLMMIAGPDLGPVKTAWCG